MSLNPWDPGFVAPPKLTEAELKERNQQIARTAGRANGRRLEETGKGHHYKSGPDPESDLSKKIAKRTEENLSDEKRMMVRAFVTEYLRDWHAGMAYIRAGGNPKTASVKGPEMLRWPYTQQLLLETTDAIEEENLVSRKTILMGLIREANHMGPDTSHGARVRALMGLARIHRMDVQVTENHTTVSGGVMLIPVADESKTIDGWARLATDSQQALKDEVRK